MSAYIIGSLIGRFIGSYILVWLVMWGVSRLQWRHAFTLTHRWYGWLSVSIVFILGMAGAGVGTVA